ncbi:MAG: T9SS type A sorting domain-containing protein, partial [Bacteroidota bacterium]
TNCQNGINIIASIGARIEGNIVGLEADGITMAGNTQYGIVLQSDSVNVGGNSPAQANLIGDNQYGIGVIGDGNHIEGNIIGTDITQTLNRGNSDIGINIHANADSNLIVDNLMAHSLYGIIAHATTLANVFSQNSIYCNSQFGTRLGVGANGSISFPVIVTPDISGVSGTANPGDLIELFEHNTSGCIGAPCQGKTFLGSAITDAAGNWTVPGPFPIGMSVTATATDAGGTSMFSLCNAVDVILDGQATQEEIEENLGLSDLQVSPNPAGRSCLIQWPFEGEVKLRLMDLQGRIIVHQGLEDSDTSYRLPLDKIAPGVYVVEVTSSFGERLSKRLIRQ